MVEPLAVHLRSAEHLIDAAAELLMDAAGVLNDAGQSESMQRLEELAVAITAEGTRLQEQRAQISNGEEAA